ncbi:putative RTA1 domain protein [Colletotrichum acutatum]|uniref:RTA1 domain protein n=1 Tax=Glomerella acutata TaxID=27357 RepID=A0AAD8UQF5_GLOAC|nr:putative RTA1 domain protein [Colletotrichum acutatum]KAK1725858.1 putative RTA1 domain protein [Colletotrichum acutatum]
MDISDCTLSTCPVSLSRIGFLPNLGGNAFMVAWFGIILVAQIVLAIRYKTWSYLVGQACGLVLEVVGYVARIRLRDDPFNNQTFIVYIVTVTIAPAFLCYTIYLCFGRIVLIYGPHVSLMPHRTYTIIFVTLDIICLILQAGGAAWSQADGLNPQDLDRALDLLRAGLGLQCASLGLFVLLSLDMGIRVLRNRSIWDTRYAHVRQHRAFTYFLMGSFAAAVLILARSAFRVEELRNGFNAAGDNAEVLFMVFEGAMIGLAVLLQTIFHPGYILDGEWRATSFFTKQPGAQHSQERAAEGESGSSLQALQKNGHE